jgi:predicted transcriptional regulator
MIRLPFGPHRRSLQPGGGDLDAFFGKLELRVLEALWRRQDDTSVRDLQADFPSTAYTTLMTTLDRLHRKGVLDREKLGRAFAYRPRYTRADLQVGLARDALGLILGPGVSPRPILSYFVDAVSRRDKALLDELERLVREKRREQQPPRRTR